MITELMNTLGVDLAAHAGADRAVHAPRDGALLEVLEPDAQLRAAELAQFSAQFLPQASDDESS